MKKPGLMAAMLCGAALIASESAWARIKLISLPVRDRVEMRLDHGSATLIEEERTVPLIAGVNTVDFSWANTQVDPNSIVLRIVSNLDARVLSVSYPPNEQALVWRVASPAAGSARVRISYLLGRIRKNFHYRALANADETRLRLAQYIRIKNESNETFGETGISLGDGSTLTRPVRNAETREVRIKRWKEVPLTKTFTASLRDFGWIDEPEKKLKVAMHYVIENTQANGLGEAALPYGKARIFQSDGRGGSAFLGEDWGKHTPPGDRMRLFLGLSRDISIKRTVQRNTRRRIEGNLFDQDVVLSYRIENFKDSAAELRLDEHIADLRRQFVGKARNGGEWALGSDTTFPTRPDAKLTDATRVVMRASLPGAVNGKAEPVEYKLHLVFKNEW